MSLLRILIIEDSENDTLLLLRALRKGGYEPVYNRVQTEETMRKALQEEAWDLILSNHNMPRFSVFGALKVYQESNMDIPFIFISAVVDEDIIKKAMQSGAHAYIKKWNLEQLIPTIQRELQEVKNLRKQL